ncbi:MAG: 3-deoxy-D-manno-octulosonic acid transferase [Acetobacteraceae bacterium]
MTATLAGLSWHGTAAALAPALRWHLARRAARGKEVAVRLDERRGIDATPRPTGRLLWVHAASVGEMVSILPVLRLLPEDMTVLLTTGTVTSAELAARRLAEPGWGGRVLHRFAPLDVPAWVARFLDHWRPDAAAFVESELWPNQIAGCARRGIPMMLVNARLSAGSFTWWRRVPGFAHRVVGGFSRIQARGEEDAARFQALGAPAVETPGDLKFAAPPLPVDQPVLDDLHRLIGGRPAWTAASTHPREEALIAAVHARLATRHPGLLTIVVPRHPERGAVLAAELAASRRSTGDGPPAGGIWIADTLGELGLWYRLAPITFVGRSLLPPGGGQNPLEPARLGCAIAVGPHVGNFVAHVALLRDADALRRVDTPDDLADFVAAMLSDPEQARAMGQRAADVVRRYEDLPARTARALVELTEGH